LKAITWALFLTVSAWFPALGQGNLNPFDLVPRLPASEVAAASTAASWETGNPFDVARAVTPRSPQAVRPVPQPGKKIKAARPQRSTQEQYKTFLFTVTVALLALLTILVTIFRPVYQRAYRGFLNENMLNQIHRESQGSGPLPYFILYGLFLLNAGTFVFLISRHFGAMLPGSLWQGWLMCTGAVSILLIAKHLLLAFLGAVFPIEKETASYSFTMLVFGILLGLLLAPANVFIAYGPAEFTRPAVMTTFGVIGLIYAFRSLRGLFIANNFLASNKFHFFLYLCTVEITPVLVLVKLIQNQV
jgi:hypothetical protein